MKSTITVSTLAELIQIVIQAYLDDRACIACRHHDEVENQRYGLGVITKCSALGISLSDTELRRLYCGDCFQTGTLLHIRAAKTLKIEVPSSNESEWDFIKIEFQPERWALQAGDIIGEWTPYRPILVQEKTIHVIVRARITAETDPETIHEFKRECEARHIDLKLTLLATKTWDVIRFKQAGLSVQFVAS